MLGPNDEPLYTDVPEPEDTPDVDLPQFEDEIDDDDGAGGIDGDDA